MDDDRIIEFERSLWIGECDVYRRCVSPHSLMVLPEEPFIMRGEHAIAAVEGTPRWDNVEISDLEVERVREGLIIIAYRADATRGAEQYEAYCTSTYCTLGDHDWRVIQHQQTVRPSA